MTFVFRRVQGYEAPSWPERPEHLQAHLDFAVDDLDAAVANAQSLGGEFIAEQITGDFRLVVIRDPNGRPLCLSGKPG
jgi:predicted enzyme related to lactoylglutathione lyase